MRQSAGGVNSTQTGLRNELQRKRKSYTNKEILSFKRWTPDGPIRQKTH